jgi:hypothetical protein
MSVIIGESNNEMLNTEDKPKSTAKGSSIKSLPEIKNRANERIIHDVFANDILEGECGHAGYTVVLCFKMLL